jgi:hypothetical protein
LVNILQNGDQNENNIQLMKICKIQYVPPLALSIESKPVVAFVFSLSLPISFHIPKLASI